MSLALQSEDYRRPQLRITSAKGGTAFDAVYHKHGIVRIGSVVDGDRGLVVMCQICMHNDTRADRTTLREETHKYYTRRLSKT